MRIACFGALVGGFCDQYETVLNSQSQRPGSVVVVGFWATGGAALGAVLDPHAAAVIEPASRAIA